MYIENDSNSIIAILSTVLELIFAIHLGYVFILGGILILFGLVLVCDSCHSFNDS